MRGRLIFLLIVAAGLAPATWLQPPVVERNIVEPVLAIETVPMPAVELGGGVRAVAVWQLRSRDVRFGGYSALASLPGGELLAASDFGSVLRLTPPDRPAQRRPWMDYVGDPYRIREKVINEIEGMTHDPATGRLWMAYEHWNMIIRRNPQLEREAVVYPPAMQDWPSNTGSESIVRLHDGRFIVLAEGTPHWFGREFPALLFPSDPVSGSAPRPFRFRPPSGYRPVDVAELPDGRVMILLRNVHFGLPPTFTSRIMMADPAAIRAGQVWPAEFVADIAAPLPTDNYEGLAVEKRAGGGAVLWLISDDNRARYQRTLLLKLLWQPNEKARGTSRAPSE